MILGFNESFDNEKMPDFRATEHRVRKESGNGIEGGRSSARCQDRTSED